MPVIDVINDPKKLSDNFSEILKILGPDENPDKNLTDFLNRVPTTHTFGYEKRIFTDPAKKATMSVYPYRKVLFEDKALLSDHARSLKDPSYTYLLRTMTKARDYGLDHFVFTYLGTHEYYYAKCNGSNMPAFGVFITPNIDYDNDKKPNATLYDLESSLISGRDPESITITTDDARLVSAYEIINHKNNDFFNYWVCDNYLAKEFHDPFMWEKKRELHYYLSVPTTEFISIIWPYEKYFSSSLNKFVFRNDTENEIKKFMADHPSVIIYPYEWTEPEGLQRFQFASYWIIKELKANSNLPTPDSFKDAFSDKFEVH